MAHSKEKNKSIENVPEKNLMAGLLDKGFKTTVLKMLQELGASLVAQWLRILLPRQGTQVRALVWEDPTCHGATKPVHHNY